MFTPIFPHRKVFTKELGKPVFVHWPEQLPHQPKNDALSFLCSKLVGCIFHVFSPYFIFWRCFGDFPIHHGLRTFDRQFGCGSKLMKPISPNASLSMCQLSYIGNSYPKSIPTKIFPLHLAGSRNSRPAYTSKIIYINEASTFTP